MQMVNNSREKSLKEEEALHRFRRVLSGITLIAMMMAGGSVVVHGAEQTQPAPVRASKITVPAQIAFTSNQQLWLLQGEDQGSQPIQVTKDGIAEIVQWSPDGSWLLFMKYPDSDSYYTSGYLWAVNKDGSQSFQVDQRPVREKPKWSHAANQFAYVVGKANGDTEEEKTFVIAKIEEKKGAAIVHSSAADFVDFSWMPDDKQILVSLEAGKSKPLTLELRDLGGKVLKTYAISEPPKTGEEIYAWAAKGMKVSPDGKHVAYFVPYNSASLSADGVPIQLFDLSQRNKKPLEIGMGLAYPQWLAWSPDSKELALIYGTDRMATYHKYVRIIDMTGKVRFEGEEDKVQSFPVWTKQTPYRLIYTNGQGTEYHFDPKKVMVPGQRIWVHTAAGEDMQLTKGTKETADLYPNPSADGKQLLFVRLDEAQHGSIYVKAGDQETELIRHVTGNIGYYANYLPEWIQVFWKE